MERREKRRLTVGPVGECVCPRCGYSEKKVAGSPCLDLFCPRCGARLIRKERLTFTIGKEKI